MYETLSVDGHLGMRSENTIDALKKHLGVTQLEIVVLHGIGEYRELLVETPPPERRRWNWRRTMIVAAVTCLMYQSIALVADPVPRIDELLVWLF